MRIWSLHPKYLDTKGLVALWRETLLAKHVLEGKTSGYKNHPQLDRFKKSKRPIEAINQYLAEIYAEASSRDYNFDRGKINWNFKRSKITVTTKQLAYETGHLLKKLQTRDIKKHKALKSKKVIDTHPIFTLIEGEIEEWEILTGT
jgi:pyrimidine dimer DNA glycosylase